MYDNYYAEYNMQKLAKNIGILCVNKPLNVSFQYGLSVLHLAYN